MSRCLRAPRHYLSQCGPRSMSPYGFPRPQWITWELWRTIWLHYCYCTYQVWKAVVHLGFGNIWSNLPSVLIFKVRFVKTRWFLFIACCNIKGRRDFMVFLIRFARGWLPKTNWSVALLSPLVMTMKTLWILMILGMPFRQPETGNLIAPTQCLVGQGHRASVVSSCSGKTGLVQVTILQSLWDLMGHFCSFRVVNHQTTGYFLAAT